MSSEPEHQISAFSRPSVPRAEAGLAECVSAATEAELDMFVEEVMYDSNANCCEFSFRDGLTPNEISQFSWLGGRNMGVGLTVNKGTSREGRT